MSLLIDSPAWQALVKHQQDMAGVPMRDLFAGDPQRFERFSMRWGEILFDYSKNRITEKTLGLLFDLARQAAVGHQDRVVAIIRSHVDAVHPRAKVAGDRQRNPRLPKAVEDQAGRKHQIAGIDEYAVFAQ